MAKYYKQAFLNIPRMQQYDMIVWLDCSIEIEFDTTMEWLVKKVLVEGHPMVAFAHEMRGGSLHNEAVASSGAKYSSETYLGQKQAVQDCLKQYDKYVKQGYSEAYWNLPEVRAVVNNNDRNVSERPIN